VQATRTRPKVVVAGGARGVVGHAGTRLLTDLADKTGLTGGFVQALGLDRVRRPAHEPGRVAVDLAVLLAGGGEAISDLVVLRQQPSLFGPVASDPTAWRVLDAIDIPALHRLRAARAAARELAWLQLLETRRSLPVTTVLGRALPGFVLDIDATIVLSHSEKESAAATWKHSFGYHPLLCFLDATGEALAGMLRRVTPGVTPPSITSPSWTRPCSRSPRRCATAVRSLSGPIRRAAATSSSLTCAACDRQVWRPSFRSGSRSPNRSGPRSPLPGIGWRPSTATAACATAPQSSSSPTRPGSNSP
jgi:hypothetical protein